MQLFQANCRSVDSCLMLNMFKGPLLGTRQSLTTASPLKMMKMHIEINEINHKYWIVMEKFAKIRSCHCTCMAGMGQSCNHVAAAMYRIEKVVKMG